MGIFVSLSSEITLLWEDPIGTTLVGHDGVVIDAWSPSVEKLGGRWGRTINCPKVDMIPIISKAATRRDHDVEEVCGVSVACSLT